MLPLWQIGKVIAIQQLTPTTRSFWIEIEGTTNFEFKPGQFVTLDLPIHEQKNKRWRSYSIASAPNGTNLIELAIVQIDGGLGTRYIFNEVVIGTELTLRGPQGIFTLPETLDKNLFFICTGTGIAPFRSMMRYLHTQQLPHLQVHLIFGGRTQNDCLYKAELQALTQAEPNFYYHAATSREVVNSPNFYHGYVHNVYENLLHNHPNASFFLCGWKQMVDEAKSRIIALGYDKKDVHIELYG